MVAALVPRVLVANPCPLTRRWIAATLSVGSRECVFELADDGVELLCRLAEDGPFQLVVASASLPGIAGTQVLAMTRTAGLRTPFLVTSIVADANLRALIAGAAPARLVDDPLDTVALRSAARELMAITSPRATTVEWHKAFATIGATMRGPAGD